MNKTIYDKLLMILQDGIPFDEADSDTYYKIVYDLHDKIYEIFPQKQPVLEESSIRPNIPIWIWVSGHRKPLLANYRDNYPEPLFWEIVDGDYMNNSRGIERQKVTHFMYLNYPEE